MKKKNYCISYSLSCVFFNDLQAMKYKSSFLPFVFIFELVRNNKVKKIKKKCSNEKVLVWFAFI